MLFSIVSTLLLLAASFSPGTEADNSSCSHIAARLSAAYISNHSFNAIDQSLEAYLDDNGVLLTMCMRFGGIIPWMECSRKDGDSKLSASWVHTNQTRGWRVIGTPFDKGPPVGLALKPTGISVRCVYPVDAATDGRDNTGCGPRSDDVRYGSKGYDHAKWYRKTMLKENVVQYKNSVFGANTTWDSIPCADFFQAQPNNSVIVSQLENTTSAIKTEWNYRTLEQFLIDQYSYIMGFPVCNESAPAPAPTFQNKNSVIYVGETWWKSEQWNSVIRLMDAMLDTHPSVDIWNEVRARCGEEITFPY